METRSFFKTLAPVFGQPTRPAAGSKAKALAVPDAPDVFGHPAASYPLSEPLAYGFHHGLFEILLRELNVRLAIAERHLDEREKSEAVQAIACAGTAAQANAICSVAPVVRGEADFSYCSSERDQQGQLRISLASVFFDPESEFFPFLSEAVFAEAYYDLNRNKAALAADAARPMRIRRLLFAEHYASDGTHLLRATLNKHAQSEIQRQRQGEPKSVPGAPTSTFSLNSVDLVDFAPGVIENHLCALAKLNESKEIGGPLYGTFDAPGRRVTVTHALTSYQFVAGDGTLRFSKQGWEDIQQQRRNIEKRVRTEGLLQIGWWRSYPEGWGDACRGTYSFSDLSLMGQVGNAVGILINPRKKGNELYFFDGRFQAQFPGLEHEYHHHPWRGIDITGETSLQLQEAADQAAKLNPLLKRHLSSIQDRLQTLEAKRQGLPRAGTEHRRKGGGGSSADYDREVDSLAVAITEQLPPSGLVAIIDLLQRGELHHLINARVPDETREEILKFLGGLEGRDPVPIKKTLVRKLQHSLGL